MTTGTVATVGLNLHSSPHDHAKLVDQIAQGDRLQILQDKGNWLHVKVLKTKTGIGVGEDGWVYRKDVSIEVEPAPAPRPVPHVEPRVVIETRASFPLWLIFAGIGAVLMLAALVKAFW